MKCKIISGNILDQDVEVIVNSWNRNIIPWWLLLPQGVSGAIKKKGGIEPFREVARYGSIPLGEARLTNSGRLNYEAIIHVAGINVFWFATEYSVKQSVISAMNLVNEKKYKSVAFPLIGSGSGNRGWEWSLNLMNTALESIESRAEVRFIKYAKGS